jgi:hypothetical protein
VPARIVAGDDEAIVVREHDSPGPRSSLFGGKRFREIPFQS